MRVTSFENFYEAFRRTRKAKLFEFDLESVLLALQCDLESEAHPS